MAGGTKEEEKMLITISVQNCAVDREYVIRVDNKQRIETTFRVLKENLPEVMLGLPEDIKVRSQRSKRRVHIHESYETEMIYGGDRLLLSSE